MTLSDLEQQLISAQEQLRIAQENFRTGKGENGLHRNIEAHAAVAAAQRALAAARGKNTPSLMTLEYNQKPPYLGLCSFRQITPLS